MPGSAALPSEIDNRLMLNCYFIDPISSTDHPSARCRQSPHGWQARDGETSRFFAGAERKGGSRRSALLYFELMIEPDLPLARRLSRLNLTHCGDTKSSKRRDVTRTRFEWENPYEAASSNLV
jgi:hypothetical protein